MAQRQESLALFREIGDPQSISVCLNALGRLALGRGDYVEAVVLHREALILGSEMGDKGGMAYSDSYLGEAVQRLGNNLRRPDIQTKSGALCLDR